jgi:hypothetical protein
MKSVMTPIGEFGNKLGFLKQLALKDKEVLLHIFNEIILNGEFPSESRQRTKVIPNFKPGPTLT